MDAFSEVLSGVRLKGALFFSAAFSEPWRLSTPHCRELTLVPNPPQMVIYHLVVDGSARGRISAGGSAPLERRYRRRSD
jgi:Cupin